MRCRLGLVFLVASSLKHEVSALGTTANPVRDYVIAASEYVDNELAPSAKESLGKTYTATKEAYHRAWNFFVTDVAPFVKEAVDTTYTAAEGAYLSASNYVVEDVAPSVQDAAGRASMAVGEAYVTASNYVVKEIAPSVKNAAGRQYTAAGEACETASNYVVEEVAPSFKDAAAKTYRAVGDAYATASNYIVDELAPSVREVAGKTISAAGEVYLMASEYVEAATRDLGTEGGMHHVTPKGSVSDGAVTVVDDNQLIEMKVRTLVEASSSGMQVLADAARQSARSSAAACTAGGIFGFLFAGPGGGLHGCAVTATMSAVASTVVQVGSRWSEQLWRARLAWKLYEWSFDTLSCEPWAVEAVPRQFHACARKHHPDKLPAEDSGQGDAARERREWHMLQFANCKLANAYIKMFRAKWGVLAAHRRTDMATFIKAYAGEWSAAFGAADEKFPAEQFDEVLRTLAERTEF